jgi:hypothetical protein
MSRASRPPITSRDDTRWSHGGTWWSRDSMRWSRGGHVLTRGGHVTARGGHVTRVGPRRCEEVRDEAKDVGNASSTRRHFGREKSAIFKSAILKLC